MKSMHISAVVLALVTLGGCASTNTTASGNSPATDPRSTPTTPVEVEGSRLGVLPVGQMIDVRLQDPLNSGTARVEQRFETTTAVDLEQDGAVLVPAGSVVRGVVSSVNKAGRVDRSGSLTLAFDQITVRGREHEMRAMATQVFESGGIREEVGTVGTAGAVGAIIGGIMGGVRGALIGAAVGSGGVIAATEGKDVDVPAGTIIRIRLDSPVRLAR